MPKIKDLISGKKEEEKPSEEQKAAAEEQSEWGTDSFTEEALQAAWEAYKAIQKQKGNSLALVTLNKEIKLLNNTEVHLMVASELEIDNINNIKYDLINFLKRKLNNRLIDIFTDVNKEKVKMKAYTNSDKFDVMIKKQPALKELKDRLGLDPDM